MVTLGKPVEYDVDDEEEMKIACDKIGVDDDWFSEENGNLATDFVLIYEPGLYIERMRDDRFYLLLHRTEYHSYSLAELEAHLLEFAVSEGMRKKPMTKQDIEEAHEAAAQKAEDDEKAREQILEKLLIDERKKRIDAELQRRIDMQEMMHDPGEDVRRIRDIMGSLRCLEAQGTNGGDMQQAFDLMVDSSVLRRIEEELDEMISSVNNESWNIVARRQRGE